MNYQEIVTAAKLYCDRQDAEVRDSVDTFIVMSESRINRLLKTREQSSRAYVPTVENQEYYSLPDDYNGMRNIQINSTAPTNTHKVCPFSYMSPEQMDTIRQKPFGGQYYYTVLANQIHIYPILDAGFTIELVYYQKVPPLTSSNKTNWLSESNPDAYISAIAAEISLFVKDYTVAQLWDEKMTRSIEEMQVSDTEQRWAGSSMTIRTL